MSRMTKLKLHWLQLTQLTGPSDASSCGRMHGEKSENRKQGRKCESCDHRRQATEIRTQNTVVSLILKQWENSKENTYAWKTQRSRAHYVCGVKNPSNTFKGEK